MYNYNIEGIVKMSFSTNTFQSDADDALYWDRNSWDVDVDSTTDFYDFHVLATQNRYFPQTSIVQGICFNENGNMAVAVQPQAGTPTEVFEFTTPGYNRSVMAKTKDLTHVKGGLLSMDFSSVDANTTRTVIDVTNFPLDESVDAIELRNAIGAGTGSGSGGTLNLTQGTADVASFVAYQAPNLPTGSTIPPQSFSTLLGIIGNTAAHNFSDYAVPTTAAAFTQDGNYSRETITHDGASRNCLVLTLKDRLDSFSNVYFYVADATNAFPSPNNFGAKELAAYLPNTSNGFSIQNMTTQTSNSHEGFIAFSDGDKKIYIYETGTGVEYLGWVNLDRIAAKQGGPEPASDYYKKAESDAKDADVLSKAKTAATAADAGVLSDALDADIQLPTITEPGQEILLKAKNVNGETTMLGATPNDITAELNSIDETAAQNIKLDAKRVIRNGTITEAHVDAAFSAKLAGVGDGGDVDLSNYPTKAEAAEIAEEAIDDALSTAPSWLQYFDHYYSGVDGIQTDITNAGQPVPAGGATFANGVFTFTTQLGSSVRLPDELSAKMASADVTVFGTIANQTGSDLHPILFESGTDGRPLLTQWKGGLDYLNLYGPGPQLRLSANGTFVNGSDIGVGAVLRDTTATGWINGREQSTVNVLWGWEADDQPTLGENNLTNTNGNFVGTQKQMIFLTTNAKYDALTTSAKSAAINAAAAWATTNDATKVLGTTFDPAELPNLVTKDELTSAIERVEVTDGSITTAKIADLAVTNAKLAGGSVGSTNIITGSVITANVANGAITGPKLGTDAVTASKVAPNAITTAKVASASITEAKLAPAVVTKLNASASAGRSNRLFHFGQICQRKTNAVSYWWSTKFFRQNLFGFGYNGNR